MRQTDLKHATDEQREQLALIHAQPEKYFRDRPTWEEFISDRVFTEQGRAGALLVRCKNYTLAIEIDGYTHL